MSLLVRARTDDVEVLRSAVTSRREGGRARDAISGVPDANACWPAPHGSFRPSRWPRRYSASSACSSRTRDACRRLVPGGTAEAGVRCPDGARRQRLANRPGDAGRDVSHRLDRPCRRVGGRGRPDTSVQRSADRAGLRCPSFCGGRRDRARRNGRGRAGATARCRAHRIPRKPFERSDVCLRPTRATPARARASIRPCCTNPAVNLFDSPFSPLSLLSQVY